MATAHTLLKIVSFDYRLLREICTEYTLIDGVYESLPLTMYDTIHDIADPSTYEFEIRPYDDFIDGRHVVVDAVDMGTTPE